MTAMPRSLTLELPDDAFSALRTSPEEFGRELRLAAAIKWYEMERISQGKAAEIAGLSRSAFVDALSRYGVSPIQETADDLDREVQRQMDASDAPRTGSDSSDA
jgi:predicted HTH domain antitoxin